MQKIDIIVKNGHIIDPAAGVDQVGCIGICSGKSVGIVPANTSADIEVDASGCYILPGLIDFHTHIFARGSSMSIPPDALLSMGVTTAVDAGSAGCSNFDIFNSTTVPGSFIRILSYLNMCSYGQPGDGFDENFDPARIQWEKIARLLEEYPEQIKGLKIRMGEELLNGLGLEPLIQTAQFAQRIGAPVVVHASNPPVSEEVLLAVLSEGDVMCHCYHGKGKNTIVDENGRVYDFVREARKRGIIFDCANGITNYNHDVAQKALADGFLPDIISTDICTPVFNRNGYGKSLPYVMSKYLSMGMSLHDIVQCTTETPAKVLGLSGKIGTLAPGAAGDLAVFRQIDAAPVYLDNFQKTMTGDTMLIPMMTIKSGDILFRQQDF